MFKKSCAHILFPFFFIVGSHAHDDGNAFVKYANKSFARVVEFNAPKLPPNDFVVNVSKLLEAAKKRGSSVKVDGLNQFNEGLTQYYLSRAYEYYYLETNPPKLFNLSAYKDPILLPNATTVKGNPELSFEDVKVYGFPPFKNCNHKIVSELNRDSPYFRNYEVKFTAPSDTVIFTGDFKAYDSKYFFMYTMTTNAYVSEQVKVRTMEGLTQSNRSTDSISFAEERLTHTYDNCLEHHAEVNASVRTAFASVLERTYLPKLVANADSFVATKFFEANVEFGRLYRKRVVELLLEAAVQYLKLKNVTGYEVAPLNFTNKIKDREVVIQYENIRVDGLLNFDKYELTHSETTAPNKTSSFLQLQDTVTVHCSQGTYLSFTTTQSGHKSVKQFKIKSFNVTAAYEANVKKIPVEVSRNKNIFDPSTGFQVKFELEGFEDFYQFMADHAAHGMSRQIDAFL